MLPAGDKDLAVGQDDAVVEGAGISHGTYGSDGGFGVGGADGDDVRVCGAVGVCSTENSVSGHAILFKARGKRE